MQDHPSFKPPTKVKVGLIIQLLFPSMKSSTTVEHGKIVGAYKNIRRKLVKEEGQAADLHATLADYGFIINKNENNFTQAICPVGVTLNGVELYKEIEIDNGKIGLKFAGKEMNIYELTGIRQIDLANELELTTALQSIKSLKPCMGFNLPNQKVICYTWGRVGHYIPVRHDMMRQTNDCSSVRVMQHKVMYFLYLT